jgi:hypothetical protein
MVIRMGVDVSANGNGLVNGYWFSPRHRPVHLRW